MASGTALERLALSWGTGAEKFENWWHQIRNARAEWESDNPKGTKADAFMAGVATAVALAELIADAESTSTSSDVRSTMAE